MRKTSLFRTGRVPAFVLCGAWLLSASCEAGKRPRVETANPICGNMVLENTEQCEYDTDCPPMPGGSTCQECECYENACGDGVVGGSEECDPLEITSSCPQGQNCSDECACVEPSGEGGMGGEGATAGSAGGGGKGGSSNGGNQGGGAGGASSGGSGGVGGGNGGCNTSFVENFYFGDDATAEALLQSFGAPDPDYLQVWFPVAASGPVTEPLAAIANTSECNAEACAFIFQDVAAGVPQVIFLCTDGTVSLTEDGLLATAGSTVECSKFEPISIDESGNVTVLDTPTCRRIGSVTMGGCELFDYVNQFGAHPAPTDMLTLDLNDDGSQDVAVIGGDHVLVHYGMGSGNFSVGTSYQFAVPNEGWLLPRRGAVLDLNGDMIDDLVVAGAPGTPTQTSCFQAGVLLGNATTASIGPGQAVTTYTYSSQAELVELTSSDLDGDGDLDLAFAARALVSSPDHIIVMLDNGGALGTPVDISVQPNSGLRALFAGPVTPGTGLDLIGLYGDAEQIAVFPGTSGVYNYQNLFTSNLPDGPNAWTPFASNGDSIPDVAISFTPSAGTPRLNVYTGSTAGTYTEAGSVFRGLSFDSLAAADFDGDGTTDIAAATGVGPQVIVHRNQGAGAFLSSGPTFLPSAGGIRIAVGDIDGDGSPDILQTDGTNALALRNRDQACP